MFTSIQFTPKITGLFTYCLKLFAVADVMLDILFLWFLILVLLRVVA